MNYQTYYKDRHIGVYEIKDDIYEGYIFTGEEIIIKSYDIIRTDNRIQWRINKINGSSIWIERLDKYIQKQRNIKLNQLGIHD